MSFSARRGECSVRIVVLAPAIDVGHRLALRYLRAIADYQEMQSLAATNGADDLLKIHVDIPTTAFQVDGTGIFAAKSVESMDVGNANDPAALVFGLLTSKESFSSAALLAGQGLHPPLISVSGTERRMPNELSAHLFLASYTEASALWFKAMGWKSVVIIGSIEISEGVTSIAQHLQASMGISTIPIVWRSIGDAMSAETLDLQVDHFDVVWFHAHPLTVTPVLRYLRKRGANVHQAYVCLHALISWSSLLSFPPDSDNALSWDGMMSLSTSHTVDSAAFVASKFNTPSTKELALRLHMSETQAIAATRPMDISTGTDDSAVVTGYIMTLCMIEGLDRCNSTDINGESGTVNANKLWACVLDEMQSESFRSCSQRYDSHQSGFTATGHVSSPVALLNIRSGDAVSSLVAIPVGTLTPDDETTRRLRPAVRSLSDVMAAISNPGSGVVWPGGASTPPVPCGAGSFRVVGQRQCQECPAGSFHQSSSNLHEMLASNYTFCPPCPVGTASGSAGTVQCLVCASLGPQYYSPMAGGTACQTCPTGAVRHNPNKVDLGDSPITVSFCECDVGFYRMDELVNQPCLPCPAGGVCLGGTAPVVAAPGYWSMPGHDGVYLCPEGQACRGGDVCEMGHSGPLCASCDVEQGWFRRGFQCDECAETQHGRNLFFISSWTIVVGVWALVSYLSMSFNTLDVMISSMQILFAISRFKIPWPPSLSVLGWVLRVANFDIDVISPTCVTNSWSREASVNLQLFIPLPFIFTSVISSFMHWYASSKPAFCKQYPNANRRLRGFAYKSTRVAVQMCISLYTAVTFAITDVYNCIDLPNGVSVLASDVNIECGSDHHRAMEIPAILGGIFYTAGIPLAMFALAWRGVSRKHSQALATPFRLSVKSDIWFHKCFSTVWDRLEPTYWYWEVVIILEKFLIIIMANSVFNPQRQAFWGLLTVFVSGSAHVYFRPFLSDTVDVVSALGHFCASVFIFTLLLFNLTSNLDDTIDELVPFTMIVFCLCTAAALLVFSQEVYALIIQQRAISDMMSWVSKLSADPTPSDVADLNSRRPREDSRNFALATLAEEGNGDFLGLPDLLSEPPQSSSRAVTPSGSVLPMISPSAARARRAPRTIRRQSSVAMQARRDSSAQSSLTEVNNHELSFRSLASFHAGFLKEWRLNKNFALHAFCFETFVCKHLELSDREAGSADFAYSLVTMFPSFLDFAFSAPESDLATLRLILNAVRDIHTKKSAMSTKVFVEADRPKLFDFLLNARAKDVRKVRQTMRAMTVEHKTFVDQQLPWSNEVFMTDIETGFAHVSSEHESDSTVRSSESLKSLSRPKRPQALLGLSLPPVHLGGPMSGPSPLNASMKVVGNIASSRLGIVTPDIDAVHDWDAVVQGMGQEVGKGGGRVGEVGHVSAPSPLNRSMAVLQKLAGDKLGILTPDPHGVGDWSVAQGALGRHVDGSENAWVQRRRDAVVTPEQSPDDGVIPPTPAVDDDFNLNSPAVQPSSQAWPTVGPPPVLNSLGRLSHVLLPASLSSNNDSRLDAASARSPNSAFANANVATPQSIPVVSEHCTVVDVAGVDLCNGDDDQSNSNMLPVTLDTTVAPVPTPVMVQPALRVEADGTDQHLPRSAVAAPSARDIISTHSVAGNVTIYAAPPLADSETPRFSSRCKAGIDDKLVSRDAPHVNRGIISGTTFVANSGTNTASHVQVPPTPTFSSVPLSSPDGHLLAGDMASVPSMPQASRLERHVTQLLSSLPQRSRSPVRRHDRANGNEIPQPSTPNIAAGPGPYVIDV